MVTRTRVTRVNQRFYDDNDDGDDDDLKCKWNWGNPHLNRKKIRAENHFTESFYLQHFQNPLIIEKRPKN